jgi:zinc protease
MSGGAKMKTSQPGKHFTFRLLIFIIFSAFIVVFNHPLTHAGLSDSPLNPYTKIKLANGLIVIVKEVHSVPIAAVDVWVKTGAKNERPEEAGISHFFEHMLFKGTTRRKVGEIAREIQAVGGYTNAQTSLDTTHYYVVVPGEQVDLALDVEADAIMNSSFDSREIERERKVILEERSLKEDNPPRKLGMMAYQAVFQGTPYANDVLGTPESLGGLTRDTFVKYHKKYYIPNNMVVVVVGDVDTSHIITRVRELFQEFKAGKKIVASQITVPKLTKIQRVEAAMQVDQTYLYFGFPGPGMDDKDIPALTLLGVILGGGQSSRLYQTLQEEKQLVNEIGAGYQSYQQIGMMAIYIQTQKASVADLESEIGTIIRQVMNQGVSGEELSRAKALVRSDIAYTMESDADIAGIIGEYQVNRDIEDVNQFNRKLMNVTVKDLQQVAKKYLKTDAYVLAIVKPQQEGKQ